MQDHTAPVTRTLSTCLWVETADLGAARFYTSPLAKTAVKVDQKLDIARLGAADDSARRRGQPAWR